MHFYKRWNNITGWAVFAVAAMVYLMTMEPVSSLWDCSEFIATSYKLEVGHPPGAPLFMMLARLATLFAFGNPDYVGIAVNAMNSLASAFCILFLFWTITHLARRLVTRDGAQLTAANTWAVLGAGAVGALAYTFTDTFWFSAVEGEVYALSSMFTALVVWLMLKWEEQADEPHSSRWIVLITYLMGLSIGVHILNLLCIPALVFIYYFRKTATVTWRGIALSTLVSGAMIVFVNNIIIPYTVWIGAQIDTLFVNTFGLPVNSGITLFALALIIGLGWAAWAAHRRGRVLLNIILLSTTMILVGYSSYASVTIRAAELQQPQQPPRPAVAPEPRPVRRPPAAVRRAVFGSPRGREGEEGVVSGRGRQVQDRHGAHGLHPRSGVHAALPPHVELLEG